MILICLFKLKTFFVFCKMIYFFYEKFNQINHKKITVIQVDYATWKILPLFIKKKMS